MMPIHTLEPAYHPKQKMSMLVDWLVTAKCNYDCNYCPVGFRGHDNSIPHPEVEHSLVMLDQMYQYADVIMSHKKEASKEVIMQILGGEVIYHPGVIEIMKQSSEKYLPYKDRWRLKRRLTTNGTATEKKWKEIVEHIEGITMSYHTQGPEKLKKFFRANVLYLKEIKLEYDVIALMYPFGKCWKDCLDFLRWAKENDINARPKILDGPLGVYEKWQLKDLEEFLDPSELIHWDKSKKDDSRGGQVDRQGRACCGGRRMCVNRQLKDHQFIVPRDEDGFKGWHCSANQFFLHGNNITGNYFTTKDCRVKLDGTTGPIANRQTMPQYIESLKARQTLPTLLCGQSKCLCGTCAPKSKDPALLGKILDIYNNRSSSSHV